MDEKIVEVYNILNYTEENITDALTGNLFESIRPGNIVVLKPNWVCESHLDKPGDWEQIITHPLITKVVLQRVIEKLHGRGKVIITDGPDCLHLLMRYYHTTLLMPGVKWQMMVELNWKLLIYEMRNGLPKRELLLRERN